MSEPTLTVAIAACGRNASLQRCLEGLAAGSVQPDQIIVVDQAASADARRLVEDIVGSAARYEPQERLGLSASRNRALALATSEYLAVTDDDCIPDAQWVERLKAAIREQNPHAVTGSVRPTRPPRAGEFAISSRERADPVRYVGRHLPWRVGTGGNFVGSVAVLRVVGGWEERLGTGSPGRAAEDIELIDRLLRSGAEIFYEPAVIVRHELQDLDRRMSTRWTYAHGLGALFAIGARAGDRYVINMVVAYLRIHAVSLFNAMIRRDTLDVRQHGRALLGLLPGAWYGIRHRGIAVSARLDASESGAV